MLDFASRFLGAVSICYVSGHPELGQSLQTGFDCSGFVRFVLQHAGLYIPDYIGQDGVRRTTRHANELWDHYGVAVDPALRRPGDLLFTTRNGVLPQHVGIVYDDERYIHAPGYDGTRVMLSPINSDLIHYNPANGPLLYASNPIGYKSPTIVLAQPTGRYHQRPI